MRDYRPLAAEIWRASELLDKLSLRTVRAFQKTREDLIDRQHGGLGLGLAIVKHLVEMHGGSVSAQSEGEGRGATFIVRLPVSAIQNREETKARPDQSSSSSGGFPKFRAMDLKGVNVLVVDDDTDARMLMRRMLGECGALVVAAESVADALQKLRESQFHVMVSDIGMPTADGYELIRRARSMGFTFKSLPAIALTAFARSDDRTRALLAGYQIHMAKPVDPSELTAAIATLVGRTGIGA